MGSLRPFVAACTRRGSIPGIYQATEDAVPHLRKRGFRCVPVGCEAVIDLATFDLAGSRRANLRHTVTRAARGGIRVEWLPAGLSGDAPVALMAGLDAVDRAWRASAGPELGFTISQFGPAALAAPVAVALARSVDGRPVALATFRPTGADRGYVLDLMRRLPGAVPGALEACLAPACVELRKAGVPRLSLGLAPLAGLDVNAASREERALAIAASRLQPLYDVANPAFFKDKFDPRWEPRVLAARGPIHLLAVTLGLLRLHLAPPGTSVRTAALRVIDGLRPSNNLGAPPPGE